MVGWQQYKSLETKLAQVRSISERIDILTELGWLLRETELDRARQYAEEAYELVTEHLPQDDIRKAKTLRNLAFYDYQQNRLFDALKTAMNVEELLWSYDSDDVLSDVIQIIQSIYYKLGDYTSGLGYALQGLELASRLGDNLGQARAHRRIANYYDEIGDSARAIEEYVRSIRYFRSIGENKDVALAEMNMATAYRRIEDYDAALEKAQSAFAYFMATQDTRNTAIIVGIIGHIHFDMGRYEEALQFHQEKLDIAEKLDDDYLRTYTFADTGQVYLAQGNVDGAIALLLKAIRLAQMTDVRPALINAYESIIEAYKIQGNYERAFSALESLTRLKERLLVDERDERRQQMMILHETQQARLDAAVERQRAEDAEARAKQDKRYFEELSQMKSQFIHSATHDLKNPLTTIRLLSQLLKRKVQPDAEKYIDQIMAQSEHMGDLIADMLDIAKLETGQALEYERYALSTLIQSIADSFQVMAEEQGVRIVVDAPNEDIYSLFDKDYMYRALSNLVSNAIKYSPDGGDVRLALSVDDNDLTITVSDTGIGIEDKHLPHIFDRFYRIYTDDTQAITGTGLGLSIVHTIITQHNGTISVDSTTGEGTIFTIQLPLLTDIVEHSRVS